MSTTTQTAAVAARKPGMDAARFGLQVLVDGEWVPLGEDRRYAAVAELRLARVAALGGKRRIRCYDYAREHIAAQHSGCRGFGCVDCAFVGAL